jgi:hypothetical protein
MQARKTWQVFLLAGDENRRCSSDSRQSGILGPKKIRQERRIGSFFLLYRIAFMAKIS